MAIAAVAAARLAGVALPPGDVAAGCAWGIGFAVLLAVVNLALLRWRANVWPADALRHVCGVIVRPLFAHVALWQIILVSALAGLGEELLFRGVLQPLVGLTAASVLFGAIHIGGRGFVGYGIWAACIGLVMGWLAMITGGLTAPIVAHGMYDALALAYVRFGVQDL